MGEPLKRGTSKTGNRTMAYTTRNTVNRLAREELYLNPNGTITFKPSDSCKKQKAFL